AKERWSNESEKVVTGDHPTLTHPSGENPARARAREGRARPRGSAHLSPVVDWGEAGERLRSRIGGDVFASWFGEIAIESADGRSVRLSTSKRTVRDWLRANFEAAIAAAFMVDRVVIEVRKPAGASPEEGAGPSSAG